LPEEVQAPPITIIDAKQRFLKDAESGPRLGESTLRKYRLMLRHLEEFAAKKGFLYLKQFDGEALRDFRDSWELSPRTSLKKLERVKAFFRFASENHWIGTNPARLVRGPANIRDTQKLPFEPAEIECILEACRKIRLQGCSNDQLLALVQILRYSGLRIGDASVLTIDRFKENDLYLYTQKSGTHVYVPLPPFRNEHVEDDQASPWPVPLYWPGVRAYGNGERSLAPQARPSVHKGSDPGWPPAPVPAHICCRAVEKGRADGGGLHSARPQ
jgi:integrase